MYFSGSTPCWGMAVPEPSWRTAYLIDAMMWAREFSAADPDQPHPQYVMDLLRCEWPEDRLTLARTIPSVDAFVLRVFGPDPVPEARVVRDAPADSLALFDVPTEVTTRLPPRHIEPTRPAVRAAPQIELDLFAATDLPPVPTAEEALATALDAVAAARDAKGELPTMDDCHRRRFGLPGMSAFNAAGGWHVVMVRFRAERCA